MCGTPLIAFSSGDATVSSSTLADAPGYVAVTVTTGGAISGYCEIGRLRIADRPASTRNTEITAAKIGRSIKKRENMSEFLRAYFFAAGAASVGADFASPDFASAAFGAPAGAGADIAPPVGAGPAPASLIGPPGISLAMPSTMTLSPTAKPDSTIHWLALAPVVHSPSTTGLGAAMSLPSLSLAAT